MEKEYAGCMNRYDNEMERISRVGMKMRNKRKIARDE